MNELLTIYQGWQATTQGEWITTAGSEGSLYENRIVVRQGEYTDPDATLIDLIDMAGLRDDCTDADLLFIANAHQDVPWLIQEILRLRAQVEQLTADTIVRADKQARLIQAMWNIQQFSLHREYKEVATKVLRDIGELQP